MIHWILRGLLTGIKTGDYPRRSPPFSLRGAPRIDVDLLEPEHCRILADVCPTAALSATADGDGQLHTLPGASAPSPGLLVDYGRCIFCGLCAEAVPGVVTMSGDFELAVREREDLRNLFLLEEGGSPAKATPMASAEERTEATAKRLRQRINALFGRSLHIRHVDAGSCNGCELELQSLTNPYYDINRLGIFIATSPRHADMLLVTGPVTRNMEGPLLATYEAMPDPKLVVAAGSCASDGGLYRDRTYAAASGLDPFLPVDAYIPGCPPNPLALIQGIMLALDRVEQREWPRVAALPGATLPGGHVHG